jgi:hypothetical protein
MLEERLNYLNVLSVEHDIITSLSYEKAIKEYAAKELSRTVQAVN